MEQTKNGLSPELEAQIDKTAEIFVNQIRVEKAKVELQAYLDNELKEGFEALKELRENEKLKGKPILDEMQANYTAIQTLLQGFIDGTGEKDIDKMSDQFKAMLDIVDKHCIELVSMLFS